MRMYYAEVENGKIVSHTAGGRVQNRRNFIKEIKDDYFILLNGYITLIDGKERYFERGWYDKDLNFISHITEQDQESIENTLLF